MRIGKQLQAANRYQSSPLECLNCNARGALTMGRTDALKPVKYICISGGFHLESGRSVPDDAMIVCDQCDEIWGFLPAAEKSN